MNEVTIQYNNPKTLRFLKAVSKYLDFVISAPKKVANNNEATDTVVMKTGAKNNDEIQASTKVINGVTIARGHGKIDHAEMERIFTESNFDAKELRSKWNRKK